MIQDLLPAVLQKILRPGGRFCACEQAGRSQEGILLFPLFCEKMTSLGFRQIFEEKHLLDGSFDLEYLLFEFCAPWTWSIIEAFNVNLVGFQFEGHSPTVASENVASAFGAGCSFLRCLNACTTVEKCWDKPFTVCRITAIPGKKNSWTPSRFAREIWE